MEKGQGFGNGHSQDYTCPLPEHYPNIMHHIKQFPNLVNTLAEGAFLIFTQLLSQSF